MRANMEVDVLMLCTGDQQQRNDEKILAAIEDKLIVDGTVSELTATSESGTFDESHAEPDDDVVCQLVNSLDERMLMPDDSRSEEVPPGIDCGPFADELVASSDVCVLPSAVSYTTPSDTVESEQEESFSDCTVVDRRNFSDCAVDASSEDAVSAVNCVASHNECDLSAPADDVSTTSCTVTENNHHTETKHDTRSPQWEKSGVSCAETTSPVSVIDTFAVVDSSDVILYDDSTLTVFLPDTESAENISASCSTDAVSADNTQHTTDVLSDEVVRLEPSEAIDVESKKAFRVRFPNDHVTGYLDPPTPWRDAALCSTPELLAAYRESCKQMGVKPLNKLVQQLEAISDFEERHELLSLRGETVDGRVCETLEEIFRRVRFRSVDLEATSLDEETAVTLFDLLDYYESCERLNISYNKNLGIRGWQACARFVKKAACLEMLEARGCSFNDPAMTMIGRSLRLGSFLRILHLENSFLSGRPLMLLVAAVKFNEILKELFLADNKLTPSDGVQLGSLLKTNYTLALLDLRNNLLQDVGLAHICDGASEQGSRSSLNTLVVWNNQITYESMMALGRALMVMRSLETINLGHNNITNEGIHRLKDGLLQNKSLLRIGLQSAKLSCEGAVALAECIAETVKLIRLDLRGNYIRTGGLMALMLALKVNQSVTRIDLDGEPKKEAGIRDYAEQQKRLLSEIATFSARNLAILAGLSPSQNAVSNSNSTVNTSVLTAQLDGQSLEAASTAINTAEDNPASTSTPCQRPSLNLTEKIARSETLESPAYVPSDFSIVPNDVTDTLVSSNRQESLSDSVLKNVMQTSSAAVPVHSAVATISIESETPAPAYEKLLPAQQAATGKTSKFAASVRRKFTVSKTVLPSSAAPPVVMFSKLATETDHPREVESADDVGRVHIVDKVPSINVSTVDKSPVCDVSLSRNTVDTAAVTDVLTASSRTVESAVIMKASESYAANTDIGELNAMTEALECVLGSDVQCAVSGKSVNNQASDNCKESTNRSVEGCSGMELEVDSAWESSAESEHSPATTSILACESGFLVDDDAADCQEMASTDDEHGIVRASQDGCPAADVSCTSGELQCANDELPSIAASNDVLVTQVTDCLAACSTVDQMATDVPSEPSLLSSDKHDALLQNLECDNSSQYPESMLHIAAAPCSSLGHEQIDDTS